MSSVLVPTQIMPAAAADGASVVIDPPGAGAPTPPAPPVGGGADCPFGAARSELILRHVTPRSGDARTYCAAMYKVFGSCGENASGGAPPNRSSGAGWYSTTTCPVVRSNRRST